jgi:VWFA-related protein
MAAPDWAGPANSNDATTERGLALTSSRARRILGTYSAAKVNNGIERHYRGPGMMPCRPNSLCAWEPIRQRGWQGGARLLLPALLVAGIVAPGQVIAGQASGEKEIATQEVQSQFKVEVQRNIVLVRAIVRDANGRPVSGLSKKDFRLFDNGKPQEIDQFAIESSGRTPAIPSQDLRKESEGEAGSEQAADNSTPRNYQALYVDDVQAKFEDLARARDAADRYLAATLTPGSRVGLFTSSGQGNLDFTDDRSKLHDALFNLRPRPTIPTETNVCPNIGYYQAYMITEQHDPTATEIATDEYFQCYCQSLPPQAQPSCRAQAPNIVEQDATSVFNRWLTQSTDVLRGLEQVVRRIALTPGQRSVIFLSPGFLSYLLEYQIGQVAERALRSNVVVNALDPRGLYVIIPGGDASVQSGTIASLGALSAKKYDIIRNEYSFAEDVLSNFASATGGTFFHNSNDLDKGFRQVGTLSEVYYVLTFSPRNLKLDGRFHQLKVSLVNPTGYAIQARRGYFAPKASEDAATKAKEEIQQAAFSQDEVRELPVDVHTQFFKLNDAEVRLTVLTHLDMSSVRFRQEQDRHLNNLTFLTVLFDLDGKYVKGKEKVLELRLRDATLAALTRTGITLKTEFDVRPGTYLVRQIVRDSEAGQLSGLNRTVEIPY